MRQRQATGMFAEDIRNGTMIGGRRVAAMTRGLLSGRPVVTVRFAGVDRKGRARLSDPVTYTVGNRVPGTRTSTTWAMPAGPVERKPGGKLHGGWYGDPDDNGRDGRAARHSRMVNCLVYA